MLLSANCRHVSAGPEQVPSWTMNWHRPTPQVRPTIPPSGFMWYLLQYINTPLPPVPPPVTHRCIETRLLGARLTSPGSDHSPTVLQLSTQLAFPRPEMVCFRQTFALLLLLMSPQWLAQVRYTGGYTAPSVGRTAFFPSSPTLAQLLRKDLTGVDDYNERAFPDVQFAQKVTFRIQVRPSHSSVAVVPPSLRYHSSRASLNPLGIPNK